MLREGMTVREAAEEWVREMDAIQQGIIEKLMEHYPDDWSEVTDPSYGRQVYVIDLPDSYEGNLHYGVVAGYDDESELYCIEMDDGFKVSLEKDDFEVEYDSDLPMWGTMWSFRDSADNYWLEELSGIGIMSRCGFRVYKSQEFGYFFGIDGAGYSFYEEHWCPLYRARGLQWHDPKVEEEHQMKNKGYHRGRLGTKDYWMDANNQVIKEVS